MFEGDFIPYISEPISKWASLKIWFSDIPYDFIIGLRKICRYLFWPKCDICGKPAYYEHYGKITKCKNCGDVEGWIYVCWNCSFKHEGHGCIE